MRSLFFGDETCVRRRCDQRGHGLCPLYCKLVARSLELDRILIAGYACIAFGFLFASITVMRYRQPQKQRFSAGIFVQRLPRDQTPAHEFARRIV
jgi:hypothetical protein